MSKELTEKQQAQQEYEQAIREFLANGGVIQQLPYHGK